MSVSFNSPSIPVNRDGVPPTGEKSGAKSSDQRAVDTVARGKIQQNGYWRVWLSSCGEEQYYPATKDTPGAEFVPEEPVQPAPYGSWRVWSSSCGEEGYVPATKDTPGAEFVLEEPVKPEPPGSWRVWSSSCGEEGYVPATKDTPGAEFFPDE